jgi:hypothetical protein
MTVYIVKWEDTQGRAQWVAFSAKDMRTQFIGYMDLYSYTTEDVLLSRAFQKES